MVLENSWRDWRNSTGARARYVYRALCQCYPTPSKFKHAQWKIVLIVV